MIVQSFLYTAVIFATLFSLGYKALEKNCDLTIQNNYGYDVLLKQNRHFGDLCLSKSSISEKEYKNEQYFFKLESIFVHDYWYSFYKDATQNKTFFIAFDSKSPLIKYFIEIKYNDFQKVEKFYNSF